MSELKSSVDTNIIFSPAAQFSESSEKQTNKHISTILLKKSFPHLDPLVKAMTRYAKKTRFSVRMGMEIWTVITVRSLPMKNSVPPSSSSSGSQNVLTHFFLTHFAKHHKYHTQSPLLIRYGARISWINTILKTLMVVSSLRRRKWRVNGWRQVLQKWGSVARRGVIICMVLGNWNQTYTKILPNVLYVQSLLNFYLENRKKLYTKFIFHRELYISIRIRI